MTLSRRNFVKKSSLTLAVLPLIDNSLFAAVPKRLTGIQLYSIRDSMKVDPLGTLTKLAEMGYTNVEHANYVDRKFYGFTPTEFKKVLVDFGLSMPSGHTVFNQDHWDAGKKNFTDKWKYTVQDAATNFITTWEVTGDEAGRRIVFPGSGSYTLDWGDGNSESATGNISHTYADAGTYRVTVSNGITRFKMGGRGSNEADQPKLKSIEQWGTAQWTNLAVAFRRASNMEYNATDTPDLSKVYSMYRMFYYANKFNGDISNWNVSNITRMDNIFIGATAFNQNLGKWFITQRELTVFDGATSGSVAGTITHKLLYLMMRYIRIPSPEVQIVISFL